MIYIKSELVLLQMGANNIFCWSGAYDNCEPSTALLRPCMSRNLTSELLWASRDPLISDARTFNQKSAIDANESGNSVEAWFYAMTSMS